MKMYGIMEINDKFEVFEFEVEEKAKTYRVLETPYHLGKSVIKKGELYEMYGAIRYKMVGLDIDELLKCWEIKIDRAEAKLQDMYDVKMDEIKRAKEVVANV